MSRSSWVPIEMEARRGMHLFVCRLFTSISSSLQEYKNITMYTNSSLSCSVLITLWKIALINLFYSYISCTAFIFRYQLNVLNFLSLEGELKVSRQKHVEQPLWNGLRSWDMRWAERRDILLQEGWEGERQTSPLYPLLASRARLEPCSTAAVEVGLPALLPKAFLLSEEESDCSNWWHPGVSDAIIHF